jgi:hypothetical protein
MMTPMIPPHSYAKGRQAEERRAENLRDGEHAGMLKIAGPAKFNLLDRLMARTGDLLIALGRELHEQCGLAQAAIEHPALRAQR